MSGIGGATGIRSRPTRRPLAKIEVLKSNESIEIHDDKGNVLLIVYNDPVSGMINITFRQSQTWRINT